MTNAEKFKTSDERIANFNKVCGPCEKVDCDRHYAIICFNTWLNDEAKEAKPLPCPFCGSNTVVKSYVTVFHGSRHLVECTDCQYRSEEKFEKDNAIAAHNRVAYAVGAGQKEEK